MPDIEPDAEAYMVTTLSKEAVEYEVFDHDPRVGQEFETSRPVWSMKVEFGADAAHRAGGAAFREAAREQERYAHKLVGVVKARPREITCPACARGKPHEIGELVCGPDGVCLLCGGTRLVLLGNRTRRRLAAYIRASVRLWPRMASWDNSSDATRYKVFAAVQEAIGEFHSARKGGG